MIFQKTKKIDDVVASLKHTIVSAVKDIYRTDISSEQVQFEKPPQDTWGEFAYPAFELAKMFSKNPVEIAKALSKWIAEKRPEYIETTELKGPYLNIHLKREEFTRVVLNQIHKEGQRFGNSALGYGKRVMIEYSSPNTNKPQHLGYLRNDVLGYSISLLQEKMGYEAVRVNLILDRGIHIMQPMVAYQKWGETSTPESTGMKPDHFVGMYDVLFSQKNKKQVEKALEGDKEYEKLEGKEKDDYKREVARNTELSKEASEMLLKWEAGDPQILKLWEKMKKWTIKGWEQTYDDLGVEFDDEIFESDIYTKGKELVFEGIQEKVFEKDEKGRVVAKLEDVGLPNRIILRADGTSLYITQDLYLARYKFDFWHIDVSVYIVASEQDLHFQQLFAMLKKLGYEFANEKQLVHRSYGLVKLPDGKMKSREGKVVDADDVIAEIIALAQKKAEESPTSPKERIDETSRAVGMGALKFFMLSHTAKSEIMYDPKKTIAFEGYTGPFVQYSYARAKSILRKANTRVSKKIDAKVLTDDESFFLVKRLAEFPKKCIEAATLYDPSIMAQYVFELAKTFNTFYHSKPILQADEDTKKARLLLAYATTEVLENGLALLGIEAPEEM